MSVGKANNSPFKSALHCEISGCPRNCAKNIVKSLAVDQRLILCCLAIKHRLHQHSDRVRQLEPKELCGCRYYKKTTRI